MPNIKAVIFDLGNTLLYFDGEWPQVFAQADQNLTLLLQEHGLDLDRDEFIREFRGRLNAYYQQREAEFIERTTAYVLTKTLTEFGHSDVPKSLVRAALEGMYGVSQAHWQPEEDAPAALEALKQAGYPLGIVSNAGDDADVQRLVDQSGLRPYFDFVLSSAACGIRKPNPKIFEIALKYWGLGAEHAAMVGDKLGADILGAHNAGMLGIWITRRADIPSNRDHAETIHPDATAASLTEIPSLIEALNS
ncbi:MAG: HAD family hydrolase [Anaerolineae bacterium]|nr:HAD family hydrolase [Anaerolineae bacterium]